MDKKDLFERAWKWIIINEPLISETKRGKSRIKMSWAGRYRILTNFPLFQPGYDLERQKNIFMSLLGLKEIEDEILMYIDKATSKFLPSASDFPNIPFTKSCITMDSLLSLNPKAPMFILTYPLAFVSEVLNLLEYQILFYSNELAFTYNVNKKLKLYLKKASQEDRQINIFRITWNSIIDSISELESLWSLESMYLIKIKPPTGQRQDLNEVEYIGIPKLQASIILDDAIRDALNRNIPVKASNGRIEKRIWILEEFIKNKPLLPHLIHNLHLYLAEPMNQRDYISKRTLVYASMVDAKVREFGSDNRLFGDHFFNSYRQLLSEIKDDARWAFGVINSVSGLFENQDDRENYANLLLRAIKRGDKYRFINAILKALVEKKGEEKVVKNITNFIFNRILPNDLSWKNYALILIAGLIGGGEADGEE